MFLISWISEALGSALLKIGADLFICLFILFHLFIFLSCFDLEDSKFFFRNFYRVPFDNKICTNSCWWGDSAVKLPMSFVFPVYSTH